MISFAAQEKNSAKKRLENLRQIALPNYLTHTCVNDACYDFIYKFVKPISIIALAKKIRVKVNSEPWFNNDIISAIQRRNKVSKLLV